MTENDRLTHRRANAAEYWSAATKKYLIERLAAYEDTGLMPDEIGEIKQERFKFGQPVYVVNEPEEEYSVYMFIATVQHFVICNPFIASGEGETLNGVDTLAIECFEAECDESTSLLVFHECCCYATEQEARRAIGCCESEDEDA